MELGFNHILRVILKKSLKCTDIRQCHLRTYFFLHMRGVLSTQRDADFDIIDQQQTNSC